MTAEAFVEHNHETEHIKEINLMQIDLAMSWEKDIDDDDEKLKAWGELYSDDFRIILDEQLDMNPNFWEDYQNESFRTEFKKKMESLLYKIG